MSLAPGSVDSEPQGEEGTMMTRKAATFATAMLLASGQGAT